MKNFILSILTLCSLCSVLMAQQTATCKPDASLPDTAIGVIPLPYSATNPKGGISDTACLNTFYDFVFTMAIPKNITISGLTLEINSISIATSGAMKNLPSGLSYTCNPPNCVFKSGEKGCILIAGTPNNPINLGQNDLKIDGLLNSFLSVPVTFPSDQFAAGNYYLYVRPQGSKACLTSSTRELSATKLRMGNVPNPFTGSTQIEVEAEIRGQFDFRVYDLTGRIISHRPVQITQGINRIPFEANNLAAGLYVFTLTDGLNTISRKMVVGR